MTSSQPAPLLPAPSPPPPAPLRPPHVWGGSSRLMVHSRPSWRGGGGGAVHDAVVVAVGSSRGRAVSCSHGGVPSSPTTPPLRRFTTGRSLVHLSPRMQMMRRHSTSSRRLVNSREEQRLSSDDDRSVVRSIDVRTPQGSEQRRPFLAAGSVKSSIFNLTSATLGAGALSIPFAIRNTGVVLGVVLLLFVGYLSITATSCVINVLNFTELKTYEELAVRTGGRAFGVVVELSIILFCFGVSVGYLISVGDIASSILSNVVPDGASWWQQVLLTRPALLVFITAFILLPLCLTDKLETLRFTSFLGVAVILFVVAVVTLFFAVHGVADGKISTLLFPSNFGAPIRASSLLVFAFSCQANVPGIYCELENQNSRRMVKVSSRSVLLCLVVYGMMGVCGFLTFGSVTDANILRNFDAQLSTNYLVVVAFAGMCVAITFAYPMNIFPCRFSIEMLVFFSQPNLISPTVQIIIAVITVAGSLICAILMPSISLMFQLVGATAGAFVSFILPGYFYVRLLPGSLFHPRKMRAGALMLFGITVAVLGTYQSISDIFNFYGDPRKKDFFLGV
eukprot:GHVS01095236.1.p1 GENE.GHVS01095236.1~~GHVS01095236.1.p1  ORF type:complete len:616 (+),score=99.59 GHVS01095236.1:157-1848(+)